MFFIFDINSITALFAVCLIVLIQNLKNGYGQYQAVSIAATKALKLLIAHLII